MIIIIIMSCKPPPSPSCSICLRPSSLAPLLPASNQPANQPTIPPTYKATTITHRFRPPFDLCSPPSLLAYPHLSSPIPCLTHSLTTLITLTTLPALPTPPTPPTPTPTPICLPSKHLPRPTSAQYHRAHQALYRPAYPLVRRTHLRVLDASQPPRLTPLPIPFTVFQPSALRSTSKRASLRDGPTGKRDCSR
jgi:hypothetical protein